MLESLICTAAMALGGITLPTPLGQLPVAAIKESPAGKTIVHIVSRDNTVTIRSGKTGLLYSLTGADGKTLVADASAETFAKMEPELYRQLRAFIAVQADATPISSADLE